MIAFIFHVKVTRLVLSSAETDQIHITIDVPVRLLCSGIGVLRSYKLVSAVGLFCHTSKK
jgi:hypothetical protein